MRLSAIGRPIDPRYPTNLAIAITTAVAFLAVLVMTWLDGDMDVGRAGHVAIAGFMAWAIAREVDPDLPYAAFVATALALGLSPAALPSLLLSFWALLLLRVVNQSPGTPTSFDGVVTILLALAASWQGLWIAAPLTALAFLADGRLRAPTRRSIWAPIPLLGLAFVWPLQLAWKLSWLHAAILFAIPLLLARQVTSVCDQGTPLRLRRVQAAAVVAVLLVLLEPQAGSAVAAALVGTGAWRLGSLVRR